MKRLGRLLLVILGLGIVVAALRTLPSTPVAAAGLAPVTVENTPLPVQGTVSVSSLPAVQISGSVNAAITNTPASPVPTLGMEALNSFTASANCVFTGTTCTNLNLYTVPARKIAVIESIDNICDLDSGTALAVVSLTGSGGDFAFFGAATAPAPSPSGGVVSAFVQNLKTYVSNSSLVLTYQATASQTSFSDLCTGTVSGYLVSVP